MSHTLVVPCACDTFVELQSGGGLTLQSGGPTQQCGGPTQQPGGLTVCPLPKGREGEIRHLFRGFAFLHCKKLVENGGMFVCKTRHLVLAGGSKPRDVTNFAMCGFTPMSPRISSPMHPSGAGQRGGFGAGGLSRGRGRRDNDLIGQTVRISQGPYK
ncbi:transcription elongation factor SPT5, partial [Pyrgilauda ruficollis]|uniref:transcription elongation factor SPT5 n=1 Tax=Pyrgilauda ruficollis TaxID=221976 RepID=UPI001B87AC0F